MLLLRECWAKHTELSILNQFSLANKLAEVEIFIPVVAAPHNGSEIVLHSSFLCEVRSGSNDEKYRTRPLSRYPEQWRPGIPILNPHIKQRHVTI